jgi:glycosyltransferase involved in cell wall biosynthesis
MIAPRLLKELPVHAKWADIIHLTAVYNFPTLPTLFSASLLKKPLVWSPRGALQRWKGSRKIVAKAAWEFFCRRFMPRVTALHVTSEEEAVESADRVGNPRTSLIANGIDIPPLPPQPVSDGILKLLFIGRLDPKKGIENLISAASMLRELGIPEWRLKIAGHGATHFVDRLRSQASSAAISDRVEFCGHVDGHSKHAAFADSDIVIVPSHTENFALVVAEALAHSRPVIASRGTPWQAIETHECGLWVGNDPASLASAIHKLSNCDRVAMGRRGRAWMERDFSWSEQARRMLSLYQELAHA